jgi:hypothetical protein
MGRDGTSCFTVIFFVGVAGRAQSCITVRPCVFRRGSAASRLTRRSRDSSDARYRGVCIDHPRRGWEREGDSRVPAERIMLKEFIDVILAFIVKLVPAPAPATPLPNLVTAASSPQ